MKTGFIAIVVLSLTVHSLGYGQDPGSGGAQCVSDCLDDLAGAGSYVARSAFRKIVKRATEDPRCTMSGEFVTCVEACQLEKYVTLAREMRVILQKYCGDDVPEATREKFLADGLKFVDAWIPELAKCGQGNTLEDRCRIISDCNLGSALSSAKNGFSDDVVTFQVNFHKVVLTSQLELSGESLPSSCNVVFDPYEPQPPSTPEPPYPYEPYPYGPYEDSPCQRNPYQSNPYQRNPYQHKPYQRNPYRRNPYQRNPHKRSPYLRRN